MVLQLGDVVGTVGGGGGRVLFDSTKTINAGYGITKVGEFTVTEPYLAGFFMNTTVRNVALEIATPSHDTIDRFVIASNKSMPIGVTGIMHLRPGTYAVNIINPNKSDVTVSRVWAVEVTNPDD